MNVGINILKRSAINDKICLRYFNHQLNDIQLAVRDLCRDFANKTLKPKATFFDKSQIFPEEHINKLAEMGFLRATISPERRGLNLDMLSLSVGVEELSRGCASTGFIAAIHNCLFVNLLNSRGTEEQKNEFLQNCDVRTLGCFALSEPGAGSDVANIQMTATKDGNDWILNGQKSWVTNAPQSKAMITFATTDKELKHNGLACFIVPLDAEGVCIGEKEGTLGVRAISTCLVTLNDVKISQANLVGEIGEGFRIAMAQLDQARIGVSAHALGIAQAAFDTALKHSTERQSSGRSLYRIPAVQDRLADMHMLIESARLLVYKAAVDMSTQNSAMAKYVAGKCATKVSDHCVQIMGGKGVSTNCDAERHYRDARGTQIYGGVTDVQKMIIGRHLITNYLRARDNKN